MTTNQTIDGVPRELVCMTIDLLQDLRRGTAIERRLRALLDAQHLVCSNGILCQNSKCAECGGNGSYRPAPQPQGEPAAYDPAKENKQFEAWARTQSLVDLRLCDIGLYYERQTGLAHDAWQYRAKLAEQPAPQGEPVAWMFKYLSHSDSPPYRSFEVTDFHQNPKAPGIAQHTPLYAEQSAPVAVVLPFADKVASKLRRFVECTDDGQGADIGRHWFDVLTHLGLLNRVQRSPALWELTQQGEDCLEVARLNTPQ